MGGILLKYKCAVAYVNSSEISISGGSRVRVIKKWRYKLLVRI